VEFRIRDARRPPRPLEEGEEDVGAANDGEDGRASQVYELGLANAGVQMERVDAVDGVEGVLDAPGGLAHGECVDIEIKAGSGAEQRGFLPGRRLQQLLLIASSHRELVSC
jgi:hypothetical protein